MIDKYDRANLADVQAVRQALEIAEEALRRRIEGGGENVRHQFVFQIGWARGRLSRVADRIAGVEDVPDAP